MATDLLARPGAAELAIIGTGVQGRAHAHAIAATRPLTGIRLAGRDPARTREVAAELAGQLGQPVTAYDDVPAAVDGADIVVTATTSSRPGAAPRLAGPGHARERGRRLRAGRPGSSTPRPWPRRPSSRTAASRSATRPATSCSREREGVVNPVRAELGELLTGTAPGRAGDDEITVFESLGLAAEDLAAASYLYEKATRLGAGTAADF